MKLSTWTGGSTHTQKVYYSSQGYQKRSNSLLRFIIGLDTSYNRGVRHDSESRTMSTESQKNHESLYKIMNHESLH